MLLPAVPACQLIPITVTAILTTVSRNSARIGNYNSRMISMEFISSKIGVNACLMRIFGFHIVE